MPAGQILSEVSLLPDEILQGENLARLIRDALTILRQIKLFVKKSKRNGGKGYTEKLEKLSFPMASKSKKFSLQYVSVATKNITSAQVACYSVALNFR